MTAGDQMFAGLLAVYPGDSALTGPTASGNFVAFSVTGCTYTVDWGNGTTQSYSAGVTAQYNYDFGSISAATTVTGVEGLSGYRQTVITAYPTVAGTTFSGIDLSAKYTQAGYTFGTSWRASWLDMRIAGSTISSLKFGNPFNNNIEQFEWVGNSGMTNTNGLLLFVGARKLKSLKGTSWTSNVTDFSFMFDNCTSLQTIPLLDTSSGTKFFDMFGSCSSLQTVPLLNTANGKDFTYMFSTCISLQNVPLLNTANGKDFSNMFTGCTTLQTVPLLNTATGNNFSSMFVSCTTLKTVPLLDTSSGTTFSNMFNACRTLDNIPLFNTANGKDFGTMFSSCSSLQTIPLLNTANGTNVQSMFSNCTSLQTIPLLNFSSAITIGSLFQGCSNLKQAATILSTRTEATPLSLNDLNLSAAAINRVFANLPTGAAFAKTCNITNNWGAAGCDRSIPFAKGWNVTG
jgi:hypothetical protein